MIESMIAERMGRLGTETAFEVLARARALEARESRSSTSRSASPTSTRRPTSARRPSGRSTPGRRTTGPRPACPSSARRSPSTSRRPAASRDARRGRRHARRQADHVLRHHGAHEPRGRGRLPEPRLPDLRVGHQLRRGGRCRSRCARRAGSASTSRSSSGASRGDQAPHHQLARQPDGRRARARDVGRIAELARHFRVPVLSDEIYRRFLYEGEFASIASLPGMEPQTLILDGFSKSYAMTGGASGSA